MFVGVFLFWFGCFFGFFFTVVKKIDPEEVKRKFPGAGSSLLREMLLLGEVIGHKNSIR